MEKTGTESEAAQPIGYARPPAEKQFKKGRSGNPKGRPKGSRSLSKLLAKILSEKVSVTEGDSVLRMSKAEALVKLTLNRAIKGDDQAIAGILALARKSGRLAEEPEPDSSVRRGYLVVPEPCHSREEWERKHGAAARGDTFFTPNGRRKVQPESISDSIEDATKFRKAGKLSDSLECYRRHMNRYERKLGKPPPNKEEVRVWCTAMFGMNQLSLDFILARRHAKALECVDETIAQLHAFKSRGGKRLEQPFILFELTRAFALMFLKRSGEALALFLKNPDATVITRDYEMPRSAYIVHCFGILRKFGLTDPLMDQVTERFVGEQPADTPNLVSENGISDGGERGSTAVNVDLSAPASPSNAASSSSQIDEEQMPDPFFDADGKALYKVTRTVAWKGQVGGKIKYIRLSPSNPL
jgi:hypothetical protein